MANILIHRIPRAEIDTFDKNKWNSNNHPIKPEEVPEGKTELEHYKNEIKKTLLCNWKSLTNCHHEIVLSKNTIETLKQCIPIGVLSRRRARNFKEELDDVEKEIAEKWLSYPAEEGNEWFVRSDRVSPKDGIEDLPMNSPKKLVDALATSDRFYKAINDGDNRLYFFKYDPTWNEDREVRVFVYKGKVTAISQYKWFSKGWFSERTDVELETIAKTIINFAEEAIKVIGSSLESKEGSKEGSKESATVDLYVEDVNKVKLVEFNSFGYWQAAGSCLFHWLVDYDILYGKTDNIVFRIVS